MFPLEIVLISGWYEDFVTFLGVTMALCFCFQNYFRNV